MNHKPKTKPSSATTAVDFHPSKTMPESATK